MNRSGSISGSPRHSVAVRIGLGAALLAVVSVLGCSAVLIPLFSRSHHDAIARELELRSQLAAEEISVYIDDLTRGMSYLARLRGLTDLPASVQQNWLEGLRRHNSAFRAVGILDAAGKVVVATPQFGEYLASGHPDLNKAFENAYLQKQDYFGLPRFDGLHQRSAGMTLAVPVRNAQDEVAGALVADVDLRFLWFVVSQIRVGQSGYAYLLDVRGRVVVWPGAPVQAVVAAAERQPLVPENPERSAYDGLKGQRVMGSASYTEDRRWRVVVEMPTDEALAPVRAMAARAAVAATLATIVAAVLGWRLSRRVTRPLAQLTEAAAEIGAGNLQVQVPAVANNELGVLAETFNAMTGRLHQSLQALQQESQQRLEVQEALRASQQQLQSIMDHSSAIIYAKDPQGRYLFANEKFFQLFHRSRENLVGKTDFDVFEGPIAKAIRANDEQVLGSGLAAEFEEKVIVDGAEQTYLSVKYLLRGSDGHPYAVCGVSTDITDRKRAEAQRAALLEREQAARQESEQANRLKDEFLAVLSHELRTPLTAILGWAQLLPRQHPNCDEELMEGLRIIEQNALAESRIVADLLDVSSILKGRLELNATEVHLSEPVERAMESVRLAAEAKRIALTAQLDRCLVVWGDASRLQQIVWNLLSNSIKFTPADGAVHVETSRCGEEAQIVIRDTGIGIAENLLPHIFERFWQADRSRTRRYGGLGLGLAIVRHLVEAHGGSAAVASEGVDKGAVFTVRLPLCSIAGEAEPAEARSAAGELKGLRALLVDDEADSRAVLARMLKGAGIEVRSAASAEEALQVMEAWRPEVLLSDIAMPGQDGYALIQQVRARGAEQGGDIPAGALTALASEEDAVRAREAGFDLHIPKPVTPQGLLEAIARLRKLGPATSARS